MGWIKYHILFAILLTVSAGGDSTAMLASAFYYDHRDRMVQSVSHNRLGGFDRSSTGYDFAGRPVASALVHTAVMAGSACRVTQRWEREFDDRGRELSVRHRIDGGGWQTLSQKSYDAVGRLASERIGGVDVAYGYDIRSRPVSMTSMRYRQKLQFTFGGNVSRMEWWADEPDPQERSYDFSYDALSRLSAARYGLGGSACWFYDTDYSYDLSGNITTLRRNGLYSRSAYGNRYALIDDLTLEYRGNRPVRVSDSCSGPYYEGAAHFRDGADEPEEYLYDANGNTVADLNRGITAVTYDVNGRPRAISFDSGAETAYIYSADGVKLQTRHSIPAVPTAVAACGAASDAVLTSVTDYCGPMVYEDGRLDRIQLEGGYLSYTGASGERLDRPEYHFYIRDHLGNNRMDIDMDGGVWQTLHYYPFGLSMGEGYRTGSQRWTFGGKEMDRVAGLDLLDFEARAYCPATARFLRPDPLASDYHPISPYAFCANNPLINTDPTGMIIKASSDDAQKMILNTIHPSDLKYVSFDHNGLLDKNAINSHTSESGNYNSIKELVNTDEMINVLRQDYYNYNDNKGYVKTRDMGDIEFDSYFSEQQPKKPTNPTTGEVGFYGKTLLPGTGESGQNSVDEQIYIIVNSGLSELGAAQAFSHEAYGHAIMYIKTGSRKSAAHDFGAGNKDYNLDLINRITKSILETISNYKTK